MLTMQTRLRFIRVLLAILVLASAAPSLLSEAVRAQTPASTLTSPEAFFGFQLGADRKLANWDKLQRSVGPNNCFDSVTLGGGAQPIGLKIFGKGGAPDVAAFGTRRPQ